MFEISSTIRQEIFFSISIVVVGLVFSKFVSSCLDKYVSYLVEQLKKIDKLIKSGKPLFFSTRLDNKDGSDTRIEDIEVKNSRGFVQEILDHLNLVLDKGISQSVKEQDKVLFLKKQLLDYLSFLKEKSYFFTIFKHKILIMLCGCVIIRWGIIYFVHSDNFTSNYRGVDIFFIVSDLVSLIFVAIKLQKKVNQNFIEENITQVKEWMDLYFYRGVCDSGIRSLVFESRSGELSSQVLKMYQKQIKEGVSYSQDICEYLEEWFSELIEKEKNSFRRSVEFFPVVDLGVIGGSVFMLLSVPICSII